MEKKLSQEELTQAQKLKQLNEALIWKLGEITADKILLDANLETIKLDYIKAQKESTAFLDELTSKYGEGKLSLETGTITPLT